LLYFMPYCSFILFNCLVKISISLIWAHVGTTITNV
jgi:hypothetical protein